MEQLTKIQRFRFSAKMDAELNNLSSYGINKSRFVRDAIQEKLNRELPQLTKPKARCCPF